MPKLRCPCGFVHNLSPIPDDGWHTIADRMYEEVIEAERRIHEISGSGLLTNDDPLTSERNRMIGVVLENTGLLYECPECGRVMWQKARQDDYRVFRPDDTI